MRTTHNRPPQGDAVMSIENFDPSQFTKVEERFVPKTAAPSTPAPKARITPIETVETPPPQKVSSKQVDSAVESDFAPQPSFESTYRSEGLPSSFLFYPFKTIRMRPLVPRDQLLIFRGRQSNNMGHTIDALSATLKQSAYDLTPGDFWYLMYQQRLSSFKKSPFTVTWNCVSDKHLGAIDALEEQIEELRKLNAEGSEDVESEEQLALRTEVERLQKMQSQITTISRSQLEINEIEPDRAEKVRAKQAEILAEYDVDVVPITMKVLCEMVEEMATIPETEREYVDFINRYAGCLSSRHGATAADRRAFIMESKHADFLNDIDEFITLSDHGVTEFFSCKCTECGIVEKVKQTIDIPHFFPRFV